MSKYTYTCKHHIHTNDNMNRQAFLAFQGVRYVNESAPARSSALYS